jgi:hypothetical protein
MDWKTLRLALAWLGYWVGVAAVAALLAATTGSAPAGSDRRSTLETPTSLDRPNISSTAP